MHEFVIAVIATEGCNNIVTTLRAVIGMVLTTRLDGFVHHVDHFEIGVMFLDSIHPSGNRLLGFVGTEIVQPVRVLGTPNQGVELEVTTVVLCPVKGSIATAPVVTAAGSFNRSPLTFVFGSNLVPQFRKVATDLTSRRNVTNELRSAIGQAGPCERDRRRRKSDRCGLSN